jgi:plasmid stabilization system protein ParE
MSYEIFWTIRAQRQLILLVKYLDFNWGQSSVKKFHALLERFIAVIIDYPEAFPIINEKKKWRRCVITKRSVLYYKIQDNKVIISGLYDTRMDPNLFIA